MAAFASFNLSLFSCYCWASMYNFETKFDILVPIKEMQAVNFLPFIMNTFNGSVFYVTDTGANLFQYADAVGLEFNRD